MGEICALHNMNDYMHFIGIVLLYIIFIVVVIYFIYNLYCKHNNIIEKYNTQPAVAGTGAVTGATTETKKQIGTIETQEPSSYYDSGNSNQNILNQISINIDRFPNHDITNDQINNIMNNKRECTIRFQEKECTDADGSNCQYTFKDWNESAIFPNKYITSTSQNINNMNDNGFLNFSCFKKPKNNGKDYVYNIFNEGISVIRGLPFNNNNKPTYQSQTENNTGNYIGMFFNTNPLDTAEAKAANLSNILNDICSYQHPIPPSLPSGTLYKLNLSKNGDDYKIDKITTATITNGVIQENTTSGDTLINIITGSNNNIIYTYENGRFKVQKTAIIKDIDNITLYKFTYNTFCFDKKIIGVEKSIINDDIKLFSSSLYSYSNTTNNKKLYPSDSDKNQIYVKYNNQDINLLNDIFLNNNDNKYIVTFRDSIINQNNTINNIIDTIITSIENEYNKKGDKVNARSTITKKKNNLNTCITNIENLRDNYLKKIKNDPSVKYITNGNVDFESYKTNLNVQNGLINENFTNFNNFDNIEGFGIGVLSPASTTYNRGLIGNCVGNTEKTNRVYTIKEQTIDTEPTVVSHPSIKGRIPDDKLPYENPLEFTFEDINNRGRLSDDGTQRIFTHKFNENVVADILVVGGGGGGGNGHGSCHEPGGGGAGGVVYMVRQTLIAGTYKVGVGNGGDSNANGYNSFIADVNNNILTLDSIKLIGKGGGKGATTSSQNGSEGGSGGGGCHSRTDGGISTQGNTFWNGTSYVPGGYNGARAPSSSRGGGGGGSREIGDTDGSGYGGNGVMVNITGDNTYYAGGGHAFPNRTTIRSNGGGGLIPNSGLGNGSDGLPKTGSGGGAAYGNNGGYYGGKGGSGIVIIKYYYISNINLSNITHKYLALTYTGTTEDKTRYEVNIPYNTSCDILIVGGGGGGGNGDGSSCEPGGGGAGGVVYMVNKILSPGKYYVYVGRGGNSNANGNDSYIDDINNNILKLDNIKLIGKGGGKGATTSSQNGSDGGSGGGGGNPRKYGGLSTQGNTFWNGKSYVPGGYNGGRAPSNSKGAGGGGGGEIGDRKGSGYGGDGVMVNILGYNTYYAGGGHAYPNRTSIRSVGGGGILPGSEFAIGGNGLPNTGSGGAGPYGCNTNYYGGKGGSGIVIIRYKLQNTEMSSIITCENDIYTYVDKNIENFNNVYQNNLFLCDSTIKFNNVEKIHDNLMANREIKARYLKYEIISGIYECQPNYRCDINLSITFRDNNDNEIPNKPDGVTYRYEIKSPDTNINLVKTDICSINKAKYKYVNNTTNIVSLKIYANVFIINKLSNLVRYTYTFTYTPIRINNFTNPTLLETFNTGLANNDYVPDSNEIPISGINNIVNTLANEPITTAKDKIKLYENQLKTDENYFVISNDCDNFASRPTECNYITNMKNIRNNYINAFSLSNINSLFTTDIIPQPTQKYINNGIVNLNSVFNIRNINDYITKEQQSDISLRVPTFTPGGYSIYFQINNNIP